MRAPLDTRYPLLNDQCFDLVVLRIFIEQLLVRILPERLRIYRLGSQFVEIEAGQIPIENFQLQTGECR